MTSNHKATLTHFYSGDKIKNNKASKKKETTTNGNKNKKKS